MARDRHRAERAAGTAAAPLFNTLELIGLSTRPPEFAMAVAAVAALNPVRIRYRRPRATERGTTGVGAQANCRAGRAGS